jgi:hypothetical protein
MAIRMFPYFGAGHERHMITRAPSAFNRSIEVAEYRRRTLPAIPAGGRPSPTQAASPPNYTAANGKVNRITVNNGSERYVDEDLSKLVTTVK